MTRPHRGINVKSRSNPGPLPPARLGTGNQRKARGALPVPRPDADSPAGRRGPAAHGIVAALALPDPSPAESEPVRPLPLPSLHQLPHDASMLYGIGRVDASGRVASHAIVSALRWQPGDKLEMILASGAIIFRASPDGLLSVPQRWPYIVIPAAARHRENIECGDYVLLAAAPEYGVAIVYELSVLNDMIAQYHSAR